MPRIGRRTFLAGAAALAGGAYGQSSGSAFAQASWPTKPVRFIAPLAAGGGLDFITRLAADIVTKEIGQQVVVENRTGAGGTIGIEAVIQSAPDGYTILATNDNLASAPHVQKLPKDYTKDVDPICLWGLQPQVFAVHPSLGINTLDELLKYAKENPGQGCATSGVGSNQHVLLAWFMQVTGANFTHVPYRGAGQAIGDLVGGQVKIACLGPTSIMPHYKAGRLRVLAQSGAKRIQPLPDFPTLGELGVKDVVLESWYAAFAPAGTPRPIVDKLNAAMNKAMADKTVRERLFQGATEPVGGTPEDLQKLFLNDAAKYARLVKELNITAK
jgi:tripartite-type tricarboxylate transporter receptor subunit TctC